MLSFGAQLMGTFTIMWSINTLIHPAAWVKVLGALGIVAGAALLLASGRPRRGPSPTTSPRPATPHRPVTRRGFTVAFATEIAAIVAAVTVLRLLERGDLITATIAAVVALHFLFFWYQTGAMVHVWTTVAGVLLAGGVLAAQLTGLLSLTDAVAIVGLGMATITVFYGQWFVRSLRS